MQSLIHAFGFGRTIFFNYFHRNGLFRLLCFVNLNQELLKAKCLSSWAYDNSSAKRVVGLGVREGSMALTSPTIKAFSSHSISFVLAELRYRHAFYRRVL